MPADYPARRKLENYEDLGNYLRMLASWEGWNGQGDYKEYLEFVEMPTGFPCIAITGFNGVGATVSYVYKGEL